MHWDKKDENWYIKTRRAKFLLRRTDKIYWVEAHFKGQKFPVFKEAWGYDPLLVRCDTLKCIGTSLKEEREKKHEFIQ